MGGGGYLYDVCFNHIRTYANKPGTKRKIVDLELEIYAETKVIGSSVCKTRPHCM